MNRARICRRLAVALVGLFWWGGAAFPAKGGEMFVYVGTYTRGDSDGIFVFRYDRRTGQLERVSAVGGVRNPSFLAISPNRKYLYAVNEIADFQGQKAGAVSAYRIDPKSGALTFINQKSSVGDGPCHLVVSNDGRHVLVANYGGGSVAVLPTDSQGALRDASSFVQHVGSSVLPRQKGPHGHCIHLDPANRFVYSCDLGLDKVLVYAFDAEGGKLSASSEAKLKPGAGPRHFAFHPTAPLAFAINEIGNTITTFQRDAETGKLTELSTVGTLPADFDQTSHTADIHVSPDGRFVYGSNRGHDSIALFSLDPKAGKLAPAGHVSTGGKTPRNFGLDPQGNYLLAANQGSDSVVVFRIDQRSGALEPTGHVQSVPRPVCVKFVELP